MLFNQICLGDPMGTFAYSNKILCFGELLLRLSPIGHERIEQTSGLQVYYDGAEAMVAIDLAHQGENVAYASCISDNRIADRGLMNLLGAGVDVTRVTRRPGRMGLFFFERGAGERRSTVIYDREHTPITMLKRSDFDWDSLLNGIDSFYFSGIVPAINKEMRLAVEDALIACKGRGVKTYCDLNYRPRMWNRAIAHDTWERLLPYVDVCIASDEDIWSIFPRPNVNPDRTTTFSYLDYYQDIAAELSELFNCEAVAIEIRSLASSGIGRWRGLLMHNGETTLSVAREVMNDEHSGCGDSFAAGIIHGIRRGWESSTIINYALTSSALKSTIPGSINHLSSEEIVAAVGSKLSIVDY
ncbi:MAG: sugar kinase [Collinsella sp.]|nr:sugar kinase [Collinsella sp.]